MKNCFGNVPLILYDKQLLNKQTNKQTSIARIALTLIFANLSGRIKCQNVHYLT